MIIIIILSFWVSKSKNKNIDNQGNENYAMIGLSIQKKKNYNYLVTFHVWLFQIKRKRS